MLVGVTEEDVLPEEEAETARRPGAWSRVPLNVLQRFCEIVGGGNYTGAGL